MKPNTATRHSFAYVMQMSRDVTKTAALFRWHLRTAGVHRPELFERTPQRRPIRIHDQRACFVTLNLAAGKSESWICDRTGHKSSAIVNAYRRAARTAAELGLGELRPLDACIPELCSIEQGVSHEVSYEATAIELSTAESLINSTLCARQGSNLHALRHEILSLACLPIPPPERGGRSVRVKRTE